MNKPTTHKVVSGDTLYSLAKRYGSTVNELKSINGLTSDTIKIGQVLNLIRTTHTVISGDTLSKLAKKYDTTVENLKLVNGLKSDLIKIGQVLKLRDVIELYWSYGDEQIRLVDDVSRYYTDLNLHIVTKGYQIGESIDATIEYDVEGGQQQFTVSGVIGNDGIAVVRNVFVDKQIFLGEE